MLKKGMTQAIYKDLHKVNSHSSLSDVSEEKQESLKLKSSTGKNPNSMTSQEGGQGLDDGLSNDQSLDEGDVFEEDQNKFSALLGLPQISLESIY